MGLQKLRREVLSPYQQNSGVSIMLVASAAMFFAVASSAFIMRTQMNTPRAIHCSQTGNAQAVRAIRVQQAQLRVQQAQAPLEASRFPCGIPILHTDSETQTILFRLCDDDL